MVSGLLTLITGSRWLPEAAVREDCDDANAACAGRIREEHDAADRPLRRPAGEKHGAFANVPLRPHCDRKGRYDKPVVSGNRS
jgi:hypothetical protein